jgi:membrane-bound serine protease (ClpP class)
MSAEEARRYGIAQYSAVDRSDLLLKLGILLKEDEYAEVGGRDPLGLGEGLGTAIAEFLQLPLMRFILILGGIICLFLEFQIPGFGVPGIIGLACFAIFFGSGLATEYVSIFELVLFLVSVLLIGLELLVIPGFGVAGVAGITGLLVSLVLAMHKPDVGDFGWEQFKEALLTTLLSTSCAVVAMVTCAKYMPKSKLVRRAGLVLDGRLAGTSRAQEPVPADAERTDPWPIGEQGVAATALRPAGKARVGETLLDVVAEGDFIDAGTPVIVVKREGPMTVVRPQREQS